MQAYYLWQKLGESIQQALVDSAIHEVMLNPCGNLWFVHESEGKIPIGSMPETEAWTFVNALAQFRHVFINEEKPFLDTTLPFNGERIHITIPPLVTAVSFNIRKRCENIFTLQDYVDQKILTVEQKTFLQTAIKEQKNILVSGGPGTGKTTLANALLDEITHVAPSGHRVLLLEDTPELQCRVENCKPMQTCTKATMRDLLWMAMRSSPDRLIIGEVRDGAALEMLKAWNTGCPGGIATIHANSAQAALQRIQDLALESTHQPPLSLMGEALDVIIQLNRDSNFPAGRRVTEIALLNGYDTNLKNFIFIPQEIVA